MTKPEFRDLVLDLATFDPSRAQAAIREQEMHGLVFSTLADEQRRRPDQWLERFTDLENTTRAGIDAPRSAEQMIERLAFLKVVPDALFLAIRGDRYVGYTCSNVAESDALTLIHGWTGVRPEERSRGLATALKLAAASYAKARGDRRIVTSPRWTNIPSLRANEKVGYRPAAEIHRPNENC